MKRQAIIPAILLSCVLGLLYAFSAKHTDDGEILKFEYSNFQGGDQFMRDTNSAFFPFVNNSGHDITIESIQSNNTAERSPYQLWNTKLPKVIKNGQRDTIFFRRIHYRAFEEGFYDHSWTINYKDIAAKQYLNLFCNLTFNKNELEIDKTTLPTVKRGEEIEFEIPIRNKGHYAVVLKRGPFYSGGQLRLTDQFPITIYPGKKVILHGTLNTSDLLNEYEVSLILETNTDESWPRLSVPIHGKLISKNYPSIKFEQTTIVKDWEYGGEGKYHFKFTNNGDVPLIIAQCQTSCGCVVADWPHEPILPGKSSEILVRYDTKRVGQYTKTVTVTSNAGSGPITLTIKGKVDPPPPSSLPKDSPSKD